MGSVSHSFSAGQPPGHAGGAPAVPACRLADHVAVQRCGESGPAGVVGVQWGRSRGAGNSRSVSPRAPGGANRHPNRDGDDPSCQLSAENGRQGAGSAVLFSGPRGVRVPAAHGTTGNGKSAHSCAAWRRLGRHGPGESERVLVQWPEEPDRMEMENPHRIGAGFHGGASSNPSGFRGETDVVRCGFVGPIATGWEGVG